ncbi:hypothetical protein PpBr36_02489 [Pyricularia pennisetigena]|uniref:hypothetical protein n=1 Tax=Pyricularia pennisetigena TaxID=1578925 RepID=UPI001154175C|nr:hypothetical protein PpBr36_02489 [Pyricularia pennisetigena]TLS30509.1 hypothetical protein PpBr36_02489 [Pyricularia pennisetigena]
MQDDIRMAEGVLTRKEAGPPYYEPLKPTPPSSIPPLNPARALGDRKTSSPAAPNRNHPSMNTLPNGFHAVSSEKHSPSGNVPWTEHLENIQNQGTPPPRPPRPHSNPQSPLSTRTSLLTRSWSPRSSTDTSGFILQHPLAQQPAAGPGVGGGGGGGGGMSRESQQEKLAQELMACQQQLEKTRQDFEAQRVALLKEIAELQTQIRLKKKQQVGVRRAAEKAAELEVMAQQRRFEQKMAELELEWKLREDAIWSQFWEMRESDLAESNRQWDKREKSIKEECRTYLRQAEQANNEIRSLVEKLESELGREQEQRRRLEAEAKERSKLLTRAHKEFEQESETERGNPPSEGGSNFHTAPQPEPSSRKDKVNEVIVEPAAPPPKAQPHHTSDEALVASIKALRRAIRDFVRIFLEAPQERIAHPAQVQPGRSTASMNNYSGVLGCVTLSGQLKDAAHLIYTENFHTFMEALLWKYLENRVLGNFIWAGRASRHLQGLFSVLQDGSQEVKQDFHHWRFATTRLILGAAGDRTAIEVEYQTKRDAAIAEIWSLTEGTKSKADDFDEYLSRIGQLVDQAAALDKEIYLRPYITTWRECHPDTHPDFDPVLMTMADGEVPPPEFNPKVVLMVFPGLAREALEEAGEDELLLQLEVLCEVGPLDRRHEESSQGVLQGAPQGLPHRQPPERPQSEPAAPFFSKKGLQQAAAACFEADDGGPRRRRSVGGILKRVWVYGQPASVQSPGR